MEKQMKCAKLVEDLKQQIMSGEIKPGDKYLPRMHLQGNTTLVDRPYVKRLISCVMKAFYMQSMGEVHFAAILLSRARVPAMLRLL